MSALPPIVAIDGPAASGKSTVGAALAEEFGFTIIDTGLTYRAFTYEALRRGVPANEPRRCARLARSIGLSLRNGCVFIGDDDVTGHVRDHEVEQNVSAYSAIPGVRTAMVRVQREVGRREPSVVIGRDIGTVVFPDAPLKLFLTASAAERARRRSVQAGSWGASKDVVGAQSDIDRRDQIDSTRAVSPTRPAPDAIVIDTSELTLDEVVEQAKELVRQWRE